MKTKPSRIALALLLIGVLAVVVWWMLRSAEQEPVYKGKPLSAWLRGYDAGMLSEERKEADEAVRQIGTNAIPILLRMMHAKDSRLTERLGVLAEKQHVIKVTYRLAWWGYYEAQHGFQALGAKGRTAVPALVELYEKNASGHRSEIAYAIGAIGPDAKMAIPSLINGLGDIDVNDRATAAWALCEIHSELQMVVPALINCLSNKSAFFRSEIAAELGGLGVDAKPAVPALVALLKDADPMVRKDAEAALKQIDPEAAAKAGVK
ncbi:MAG: repeat protein [Pedosphaera sp.]|nr:repeat protein [Pedosphaera sp.]